MDQERRVRCNHCMSIFGEEYIDVDALGPDSGETCPVCSKGDALMDMEPAPDIAAEVVRLKAEVAAIRKEFADRAVEWVMTAPGPLIMNSDRNDFLNKCPFHEPPIAERLKAIQERKEKEALLKGAKNTEQQVQPDGASLAGQLKDRWILATCKKT